MKQVLLAALAISLGSYAPAVAQTTTQNTATGSSARAPKASTTGAKSAGQALPGTKGDVKTNRTAQGAKAGSRTEAGLTGAQPSEQSGKSQSAKGPSRDAMNAKTSTVSTSGKTGSRRPSSMAQVEKEAHTSDGLTSTGYPEPTGPGKPGTPGTQSGNAKGKTSAKSKGTQK